MLAGPVLTPSHGATMVKANRKRTSKAQCRRPTVARTTEPAPAFESSGQVHQLMADDLHAGLEKPGDKPAERQTRRFLFNLMRRLPNPPRGRKKADWRRECQQRFKVSIRGFDRIWDEIVAFTGAVAYRSSGPRDRVNNS
jgi:hypothetical protein